MVDFFESDDRHQHRVMTWSMGALLLLMGGLKIVLHLQDPFARMVLCGPDGTSSLMSFAVHCWGCPVALIGAALMVVSQSRKMSA